VLIVACVAAALCFPAGAFASAFNFTELTPPYLPPSSDAGKSLVTGDYDHDGKTDIAFVNSSGFFPEQQNCTPMGCVSVLLGHGDATFAGQQCEPPLTGATCPINYPSQGEPYFGTASLAEGDLTGNGNTDLVVANFIGTGVCPISGCLSILYGNSNGTFQDPVALTADTDAPLEVVVGDFNGDGRPDIAIANGLETVTVLLNQGTDAQGHAIFKPASGSPFPLAGAPAGATVGMTTADLTGHGKVDLVLSVQPGFGSQGTCGTSNCVEVLTDLNDGSGNFSPAVAYPVDGSGQIAAADLRGTGRDDVLVPGGAGFQVLLNQGNGTLGTPSQPFTYPDAANPQALAVADFNNDGKLDVAMADFGSAITVLFKGNGDGTFTYDDTVSDPSMAQNTDDALAAADFNGDCKPDLALGSDSGLIVMRNDTPPAGSVCPKPPPPPPPPPGPTPKPTPTSTPPSQKPTKKQHLVKVTQRIKVAGTPKACTKSALKLHIRIVLAPRAVASRRGRLEVNVKTVIALGQSQIHTSNRRAFVLRLPLHHFPVGLNTLKITATSSGKGVRGTRKTRMVHFTRCLTAPVFTG
jgi:hypothetical protein